MFAKAGFEVTGIRRDSGKIAQINQAICPIEGKEPGLPELLAEVVRQGRLKATTDYKVCREARVVLIAVETPVDKTTKKPGYEALRATLQGLGQNLQAGPWSSSNQPLLLGRWRQWLSPFWRKHLV
jgi:UDP-N-acetyl-D-mannosaminuronic acid dehydrogenase